MGRRRPPLQLGLALAPAFTRCLLLRALRQARILTAGIQRASELSRISRGSSSFSNQRLIHRPALALSSTLVNGALAVPGAPTDVDTVPSKFSARTAADDALPIAAYTLRHLTDEQRRGIFQSVNKRGSPIEPAHIDAIIGALVPISVALNGLSALPENVIASIPELRDVMFTTAGEKLLLVNPRTRVVIGVLSP